MTNDRKIKKKSSGSGGVILAVGVIISLIVVGCIIGAIIIIIGKRKNSTGGTTTGGTTTGGTTTGGTTTGGTTTGGTTTGYVTSAASINLPSNLVTVYSNNYYVPPDSDSSSTTPTLIARTSTQSSTPTSTSDPNWTTPLYCNLFNSTYGAVNPLLTRYDIITSVKIFLGTVVGNTTIQTIGVNSASASPTYPAGYTKVATFYAFSSSVASSDSTIKNLVSTGSLIPVVLYSNNLGDSTTRPSNFLLPTYISNAAVSATLKTNFPNGFSMLYTIYTAKGQTKVN